MGKQYAHVQDGQVVGWHSVTHTGTDHGQDRPDGNPAPDGWLPVEQHTAPDVDPGYRALFQGWTIHPDRVVGGWTVEQQPQPFPSWNWVDGKGWVPPTPMPDDGNLYRWDEQQQTWIEDDDG